ncbi:secreted RxLR effector protein 161-like [Cryptomeria japonica]|uniref:secreted RxLR effector protein 161-like n=1 Tax=Cryptomeria japonica TaxID=3369 RepID=UPI0027DA4FE0|nr:secreted RxLR effector protein 161-like [Cryptomeria japonica]
MVTGCKLSKEDESSDANQTLYRSMIGSLLYVIAPRPDIMQVVGVVARYEVAPKEGHVQAVKKIFKYLRGTMDFGLWYPKGDDFTLKAYTNVDWAGNIDDIKNTSGGAFFLGNNLVSWLSKKQASVPLSIAEAEYIAATTFCTQVLWMKQTLKDIKVEYDHPISIFCDNTSAINISNNPVMHSRTKHIPIKFHFLREQVLEQ